MDKRTVRLWPDQVLALQVYVSEQRRRFRGHGGPVFTGATLMRVALDVFLRDHGELWAADEFALRAALGLPVRRADGTLEASTAGSGDEPGPAGPVVPVVPVVRWRRGRRRVAFRRHGR